jgi:hypothetical protein
VKVIDEDGVLRYVAERPAAAMRGEERTVPKIRHLAVICMNPEKLAEFYTEVF